MALPLFCMEPLTEQTLFLLVDWDHRVNNVSTQVHLLMKAGLFFFKLSVLTSFLNVQYRTGLFIGLFTAGI